MWSTAQSCAYLHLNQSCFYIRCPHYDKDTRPVWKISRFVLMSLFGTNILICLFINWHQNGWFSWSFFSVSCEQCLKQLINPSNKICSVISFLNASDINSALNIQHWILSFRQIYNGKRNANDCTIQIHYKTIKKTSKT